MGRSPGQGGAFSPGADYDVGGDWNFRTPPSLGGSADRVASIAQLGAILPQQYGAVGNGITDDTTAWQRTLDASKARNGIPIRDPGGRYVITQPLTWLTGVDQVAGPTIHGAGRYATVFDSRVANGPLLRIDQTAPLKFQRGGTLSNFSIVTTTQPAGSTGLSLSALYQSAVEDVYIAGLSGDGIQIDLQLGDADGPNQLTFDRVWIEHCAGYGVNVTQANAASEHSFFTARSCFFQYNTRGGVRFRGLIGTFDQCAFVRNSPANQGTGGLVVYATPNGSSRCVAVRGCDFEGNGVCHLDLQSVGNAEIRLCEFLHNVGDIGPNPIGAGVKIGGSGLPNGVAANIEIVGSFVRNSTPGHVAFAIGSDAVDTRIRGTRWDVFPGGQTRFSDGGVGTVIEDRA